MELTNKIKRLEEEIKELSSEYLVKKEEIKALSQESMKHDEQISSYKAYIEEINQEKINPLSDNNFTVTPVTDNETDQRLVLESLKKKLEEISRSLSETQPFQKEKSHENEEQLYFPSIMVDFVEKNDEQKITVKTQVFQILPWTKVHELVECCLALFDIQANINDYTLYLIDGEKQVTLDHADNINQSFKLNKSQIKSPHFILSPATHKVTQEDFSQSDKKDVKDLIVHNESLNDYINFTKMITGLSDYIRRKYNIIREKERKGQEENQKPNKTWIYLIIHSVFFFLFFIFSIVSVNYTSSPQYSNITSKALKAEISFPYEGNLKSDIIARLKPFLEEGIKGEYYKLVSMARFSFYLSFEEKCSSSFSETQSGGKICYHPFYKKNKANPLYIYHDTSFIDQNCNDFHLFPLEQVDSETCKNIFEQIFFKGYYSTTNFKVGKTKIEGNYGKYKADYTEDIFMSLNYMNEKALEKIVTIMENMSLFSYQNTKSFVIDFTLTNIETKIYYFVSFLYEMPNSGGVSEVKVEVKPFSANFKSQKHGKLVFTFDIFRIIFAIFICFTTIRLGYEKYSEEMNLRNKKLPSKNCFQILFKLNILSDLIIFILYIVIISLKFHFLLINVSKAEEVTTVGGTFALNAKEYYPILDKFEKVMELEGVVFIFLLLRIIGFANLYHRLRNFMKYLRGAIMKVLQFFVMFIVLISLFSIFMHILFGENSNGNIEYSSSFLNTLAYSIGHFRDAFTSSHIDYEVVFNFMYFISIIYFQGYIILSIITDSYRINSLKMGSIYQQRIKKKFRRKGDIIQHSEAPLNSARGETQSNFVDK